MQNFKYFFNLSLAATKWVSFNNPIDTFCARRSCQRAHESKIFGIIIKFDKRVNIKVNFILVSLIFWEIIQQFIKKIARNIIIRSINKHTQNSKFTSFICVNKMNFHIEVVPVKRIFTWRMKMELVQVKFIRIIKNDVIFFNVFISKFYFNSVPVIEESQLVFIVRVNINFNFVFISFRTPNIDRGLHFSFTASSISSTKTSPMFRSIITRIRPFWTFSVCFTFLKLAAFVTEALGCKEQSKTHNKSFHGSIKE
mmetsp:Transcript_23609/g.35907  ORF Transcript_23609/g.35907 Transcript_23609/m.35907 type:complete len:254 (-) Transcript_23609:46-807(-)